MTNRNMHLSGTGKEILDTLCAALEIERPLAITLCLAKAIKHSSGIITEDFKDEKKMWSIPDGVIKEREFLLFKHLIINEVGIPLLEKDLHTQILLHIEQGLRIIEKEMTSLVAMEDYRIKILT